MAKEPQRKPWTAPAWLAPYVPLIGNTGGWITPEERAPVANLREYVMDRLHEDNILERAVRDLAAA